MRDRLALLYETWNEFEKDECGQLTAPLSYYATFSVFPLLILLLGGIGFFLDPATSILRRGRLICNCLRTSRMLTSS